MLGFFKNKSKGKVICSPCNGRVVPITEVPDPTFSEKILGDGVAVIPSEGRFYAPADGEVTAVFDTLHAFTMTTTQGVELLLHIGLDTVTLKGDPFKSHISVGDQVKKGDLLKMDVGGYDLNLFKTKKHHFSIEKWCFFVLINLHQSINMASPYTPNL